MPRNGFYRSLRELPRIPQSGVGSRKVGKSISPSVSPLTSIDQGGVRRTMRFQSRIMSGGGLPFPTPSPSRSTRMMPMSTNTSNTSKLSSKRSDKSSSPPPSITGSFKPLKPTEPHRLSVATSASNFSYVPAGPDLPLPNTLMAKTTKAVQTETNKLALGESYWFDPSLDFKVQVLFKFPVRSFVYCQKGEYNLLANETEVKLVSLSQSKESCIVVLALGDLEKKPWVFLVDDDLNVKFTLFGSLVFFRQGDTSFYVMVFDVHSRFLEGFLKLRCRTKSNPDPAILPVFQETEVYKHFVADYQIWQDVNQALKDLLGNAPPPAIEWSLFVPVMEPPYTLSYQDTLAKFRGKPAAYNRSQALDPSAVLTHVQSRDNQPDRQRMMTNTFQFSPLAEVAAGNLGAPKSSPTVSPSKQPSQQESSTASLSERLELVERLKEHAKKIKEIPFAGNPPEGLAVIKLPEKIEPLEIEPPNKYPAFVKIDPIPNIDLDLLVAQPIKAMSKKNTSSGASPLNSLSGPRRKSRVRSRRVSQHKRR